MARRKDLKNILQGIVGAFVSRNNDLNGYWAIGKIYKAAVDHKIEIVHLDLLGSSSSLGTAEINQLAQIWSEKLATELAKCNIPKGWLRTAKMTCEFTTDVQNIEVSGIYPVGDLGKYTFEIITDIGSTYSQSKIVKCRQHDASREQKRK